MVVPPLTPAVTRFPKVTMDVSFFLEASSHAQSCGPVNYFTGSFPPKPALSTRPHRRSHVRIASRRPVRTDTGPLTVASSTYGRV